MATPSSLRGIQRELEVAALRSGDVVRRAFHGGRFKTHLKTDKTEVTNADLESQRTIRRALQRRLPGVPTFSEEDYPDRGLDPSQPFVLIDPIDGTSNFTAGIPVFFVSIAYLSDGLPRAGVLFNPVSGEMLTATEGGGAYRRSEMLGGNDRIRRTRPRVRLHTAPYRDLSECTIYRHDRKLDPGLASIIAMRIALRSRGVKDLGSTTAETALIAAGHGDALIGYSVANWDVAAGALILKEAGGVMSRLDGKTIQFVDPGKFSICAAGNRRLHRQLIRLAGRGEAPSVTAVSSALSQARRRRRGARPARGESQT